MDDPVLTLDLPSLKVTKDMVSSDSSSMESPLDSFKPTNMECLSSLLRLIHCCLRLECREKGRTTSRFSLIWYMPSPHCNGCFTPSPHTQNQLVQHFLRWECRNQHLFELLGVLRMM
ncbi:hypothetical protein TNCV_4643081 [Trichonephila clavipes]|nr:hypothetical protein TNCV_4643081 [Trichonephila clavipes]